MPAPLSPAQRDVLALLGRDLSPDTWDEVRDLLADYFARRTVEAADQAWDERGYTDADADRLLHGHERRRSG